MTEEANEPPESEDPLAPSRGCLFGLLVSIALWLFLAFLLAPLWAPPGWSPW